MRVLGGPLGRGERLFIPAETVVANRATPVVCPEPQPFAAPEHVLATSFGQRYGLGVSAAPVRQRDCGAQGQMAPGGLDDDFRLSGQCRSERESPREQLDGDPVTESDREQGEGSGLSGELELP